MNDFPDTRASLLVNIRDPADERAWSVFSALYRPVIYRMARRRGMQDADAQDLAQEVLVSVSKSIGKLATGPGQPKFRNWLSRVTRNEIVDAFRKRKPDNAEGGSNAANVLKQSPAADETEIEYEYERAIFRRAASLVKGEFQENSWTAFWQTTVVGESVASTAVQVGRSPGAIYTARSRVMKRIKAVVEELKLVSSVNDK